MLRFTIMLIFLCLIVIFNNFLFSSRTPKDDAPSIANAQTCAQYYSSGLNTQFRYYSNWKVRDEGEWVDIIPPWSYTHPKEVTGDDDLWIFAIHLSPVKIIKSFSDATEETLEIAKNLIVNSNSPNSGATPVILTFISLPVSGQTQEEITAYVKTASGWLQVNIGANTYGLLSEADVEAFNLVVNSLAYQSRDNQSSCSH